ncbi:MAG: mevalonate kinase, partial [Anaerolineales bacterium]
MQIIRRRTYARAGLLGNPSDGYNGKTISFSVRDFWSEVVLYEWDRLEIVLAERDRASFRSIHDLAEDVRLHGYYGGIRLIKATIKRFVEYCATNAIPLHDRTFSVRYESNIPQQVGLAGSSALIIATLRCLMAFYEIDIPQAILPSLALSVETDELGIGAGLQDRVIQVYEGLVYMDFAAERAKKQGGLRGYHYERLSIPADFPVYVAYHTNLSEPTETFHNDLRGRFARGDAEVVSAMADFAALTDEGRAALLAGDMARLGALIDANFDTRQRIARLPGWQVRMVETARACGASAKFAGSGGAIVGLYQGAAMLAALRAGLA